MSIFLGIAGTLFIQYLFYRWAKRLDPVKKKFPIAGRVKKVYLRR
jgi:hypothetical protein